MFAVFHGHLSTARLLLERGAAMELPIEGKNPTLVCAVQGGHADCVRLLLDYGADVNIRAGGKSVLQWAREMGTDEMVEMLLRVGAE